MVLEIELKIDPDYLHDEPFIVKKLAKKAKISPSKISEVRLIRRSIDARSSSPFFLLRYNVFIDENNQPAESIHSHYPRVSNSKAVHIIGTGPAGYFAALELIESGIKPILFDRGKDVRQRRRDLRSIQQFHTVNPDSNYCFGEGGAGTYSDGKLYTKSLKRGNYRKVLQLLVEHGANSDILVDAHPHIGSNKLPKVVESIRKTILERGGEIYFNSKLTDFNISDGKIASFIINNQEEIKCDTLVLATGHSARDIFYLLGNKQLLLESKPFALGVRVEHPQALIDEIQYNQKPRHKNLPAAAYKLTSQVNGSGVFSFCMCPGGLIVPAATAPGEIVVNGMSMSKRDSLYANSGIVVALEDKMPELFSDTGVFAGLEFQKSVEQMVFNAGDGSQKAPAMRMTDFVNGKLSGKLNPSSYIPGLYASNLTELLPDFIVHRLTQAFISFGKKMKGYYTDEANVVGVESRTSSPIRIPRNKSSLMHPQVEALFPCGEGAGYAGGILSAAMDGQNVAKAVAAYVKH